MISISRIYRPSALRTLGLFVVVALFGLLIAGRFIIPVYINDEDTPQIFTLRGEHFQYSDRAHLVSFVNSIKKHSGILCLGTSESTDLKNGNYYNFLNADAAVENKFSILSGAGRTAGVYVPFLLANRDLADSLNLVYFINPVYWRTDLAEQNTSYWNRYNSYGFVKYLRPKPDEEEYFADIKMWFQNLNIWEKTMSNIVFTIREHRKKFFQDLRYLVFPESFSKNHAYITPKKTSDFTYYYRFGEVDFDDIDTVWNIQYSFKEKHWFKPINTECQYRYEELRRFGRLCKHLNINAVFILGPYNERFVKMYKPGCNDTYENVVNNIRNLLEEEELSYIDASDISGKAGTFIDHQHHSSYGAYLIYKKIKTFLHEENSH